jgi:hypothetical protein
MKKALITSLLAIAVISYSFIDESNPLVGKWEWSKKFKDGPLTVLAVFKVNGTYDGFANKKSFVSGTYKVVKDTLFIADPLCNSKYMATYKLKFFGNKDSVQFNVIQDTCAQRRNSVNGFIYKKVLTAK